MAYRRRIFFTDKQKSEIWDRWQRGESMSSIGRLFDRESSSIYPLLARTGGIRPPDRVRSRLALTLSERGDIQRLAGADLASFNYPNTKEVGIHNQSRGKEQWWHRGLSCCGSRTCGG